MPDAHQIRILVVTNDPSRPRELEALLEAELNARILFADTVNAVARVFDAESVDIALIFADTSESELLESVSLQLRENQEHVPLVAAIEPEDAEAALELAAIGVEGFVSAHNRRQLRRILVRLIEFIRARRQAQAAERRLSEIEDRYTLLLESSSEAIAYLHEGLHIFANPAYLSLFGFESFDELEGLSMLDLLQARSGGPDLRQVLKALDRDDLPSEALHVTARRDDGEDFNAVVAFSRARFSGEACAQMLVREDRLDADPALAAELDKLKQSDLITGLLNQSAFLQHINQHIDQALSGGQSATGLAILMMSIDEPDRAQIRIGIGGTDTLIRRAGRMFRESLGTDALMARLRDHHFAALVELEGDDLGDELAARIVESCSGRVLDVGEISLPVTASVGLAQGSSGQIDAETMVTQAELALNEALRAGGNAYVKYRPRINADADQDDMAWSERLIHALDHDEIRLMTSQITSMEEDAATIYEIESRLRAEDSDEVLLPSVFLSAANRLGLAPRLDRHLLKRLAGAIAEHEPERDDLWMVTLAVASIRDASFNDHLEKLMTRGTLPANRMIWAFRDIEVQDSLRQTQEFIQRFGPIGCRFALGEVVPDHATEATLRYLELDFVRLSPEMVLNLGENEALRQSLNDLVRECAKNHVRIIAPKVENTSDLAMLWQLGITLVQGDFVREQATF